MRVYRQRLHQPPSPLAEDDSDDEHNIFNQVKLIVDQVAREQTTVTNLANQVTLNRTLITDLAHQVEQQAHQVEQ